jgi:hypothetical protein
MLNKIKIYLPLLFIALFFLSCSREDPNPLTPTPTQEVKVKINEIYSRGDTVNPDWIEIYNPSTSQMNISGYKIYDAGGQSGTKPKKLFTSGTIIPAHGFVVIVVDDTTSSGFGLSSSGEQVWLENSSGTVIDNVTFSSLDTNQSYIRYPDGSANWITTDSITKGIANVFKTSFPIRINEIYSNGNSTDPDWVEVYNLLDTQLDISGYKIYDNGGNSGSKPKKVFPAGTVISGKGFFVITVDDTTSSGFDLSSSGEKVWVADSSGNVADSIIFPALGVDTSYGRQPDGTDSWLKLSPATKGSSNNTSGLVNLVMNEIYSRGIVGDPDWIEIYNPNPVQVDLSGYKIYDTGGQTGAKAKKEFPAGTVIPANGFYVIVTDDGTASAFGLSSSGEEVWLENAAGTVIDDVTFTAMATTQSYSRIPNGSTNWQLTDTITRGASNQ